MTKRTPLFERAINEGWHKLPPELHAAHAVHDSLQLSGRVNVQRSGNAIIDGLGNLLSLPPEGTDIPLRVTMERVAEGEIWTRRFGDHQFRSVIMPSKEPRRIWEKVGPVAVEIELGTADEKIRHRAVRSRFAGIPIPKVFAPISRAEESIKDGRYHFDVTMSAPLGVGLLVAYQGWLVPDAVSRSGSKDL